MSFSCRSSCGDFFFPRMATATSLLSSLEMAIGQRKLEQSTRLEFFLKSAHRKFPVLRQCYIDVN